MVQDKEQVQEIMVVQEVQEVQTFLEEMLVLLADLVPKRLGMNDPERLAMLTVGPMLWLTALLKPLVKLEPLTH